MTKLDQAKETCAKVLAYFLELNLSGEEKETLRPQIRCMVKLTTRSEVLQSVGDGARALRLAKDALREVENIRLLRELNEEEGVFLMDSPDCYGPPLG